MTLSETFRVMKVAFQCVKVRIADKWPSDGRRGFEVVSLTLAGSPDANDGPFHVHVCHDEDGFSFSIVSVRLSVYSSFSFP